MTGSEKGGGAVCLPSQGMTEGKARIGKEETAPPCSRIYLRPVGILRERPSTASRKAFSDTDGWTPRNLTAARIFRSRATIDRAVGMQTPRASATSRHVLRVFMASSSWAVVSWSRFIFYFSSVPANKDASPCDSSAAMRLRRACSQYDFFSSHPTNRRPNLSAT